MWPLERIMFSFQFSRLNPPAKFQRWRWFPRVMIRWDHQAWGVLPGVDPSSVLAAVDSETDTELCQAQVFHLQCQPSGGCSGCPERLRTGKRKGEDFMFLEWELHARPRAGDFPTARLLILTSCLWSGCFCHHLKMHIFYLNIYAYLKMHMCYYCRFNAYFLSNLVKQHIGI